MTSSSNKAALRPPETALADVYGRVAQRRKRARRTVTVALVAVLVAGVAVPVGLLVVRGHHIRVTTTNPPPTAGVTTSTWSRPTAGVTTTKPPRPNGALPYWTPPAGPPVPAPAVFVNGDNAGGIGVYATATGQLIRTIIAQASGGLDQQPVLSFDRQTVYFAQLSGGIMSGPVSGASAPTSRILVPGTIALEPSPSPSGRYLAWVGVICPASGCKSTLFVTDLTSGAKTTLGAFSGDNSGDGIAWSPMGAVSRSRTAALSSSPIPPSRCL